MSINLFFIYFLLSGQIDQEKKNNFQNFGRLSKDTLTNWMKIINLGNNTKSNVLLGKG